MICLTISCLLCGTIAALDGFPPSVKWQIRPLSCRVPTRLTAPLQKGARLCVTCVECKDTSDWVAQRTSIHAYDCFVWWWDFRAHRGWEGGTSASEMSRCFVNTGVGLSQAAAERLMEWDDYQWDLNMVIGPWKYCTHGGKNELIIQQLRKLNFPNNDS